MGLRQDRLASQIKQSLAPLIRQDYPNLSNNLFSISYVRVSADISWANVYCTSLLETEEHQEKVKLLQSNASSLRHQLSQELNLRKSPSLRFYSDEVSEKTRRIDNLLDKK